MSGADLERDALQHQRIAVPKAHILKANRPVHGPRNPGLIFIQVGLVADDVQNASSASQAGLSKRSGKDRNKGWKAQHIRQAHHGDDLVQLDPSATIQPHRVEEGQSKGDAVHQQGQVARLDRALASKQIAVQPGVTPKLGPLKRFARAGLHNFDPGKRFFQARVHGAKLLTLLPHYGRELADIKAYRHQVADHEADGNQQHLCFHDADIEQRHDDAKH